jgi:hypothetical protein
MSAVDLRIDKELQESEIKQFLSKHFSIPDKSILLTDEITGQEDISQTKILCVVKHIKGEFPVHLNINIYFEKRGIGPEDEIARAMSKMFECRVLTISDDENPYIWFLYDKVGTKIRVLLDDEKLDEYEETVIIKQI